MKAQLFDKGETIYIRDEDVVAVATSAEDETSVGVFTRDGRVFKIRAQDGTTVARNVGIA